MNPYLSDSRVCRCPSVLFVLPKQPLNKKSRGRWSKDFFVLFCFFGCVIRDPGLFCSAQPSLTFVISSSCFFALKSHDGRLSSKCHVFIQQTPKRKGTGSKWITLHCPHPILPYLLKRKTLSRSFPTDFPLNLIWSFAIFRPAIGLDAPHLIPGAGYINTQPVEICYQERRERMAV